MFATLNAPYSPFTHEKTLEGMYQHYRHTTCHVCSSERGHREFASEVVFPFVFQYLSFVQQV